MEARLRPCPSPEGRGEVGCTKGRKDDGGCYVNFRLRDCPFPDAVMWIPRLFSVESEPAGTFPHFKVNHIPSATAHLPIRIQTLGSTVNPMNIQLQFDFVSLVGISRDVARLLCSLD